MGWRRVLRPLQRLVDEPAWRAYLAADEAYERADRRLRSTAYEPTVIQALATGPVDSALEFLSAHRPMNVINRSLDVLLKLAIEGGSEQGQVRELVLAADRSAVAEALPGLVARVVDGPNEGHSAYLDYFGLMDLLERLEQRDLLRDVVRAARRSPDPEIHSAADDFDDDFGGLDVHLDVHPEEKPAIPRTESPQRETPDPEAARAWADYVVALTRRNRTRGALLRRGELTQHDLAAGLSAHLPSDGRAAARLAAEMLDSDLYANDVLEALRSLDTASLREASVHLADAVLADRWHRAKYYRALLTLLAELPDGAGLAAARERARTSDDPEIRGLAS